MTAPAVKACGGELEAHRVGRGVERAQLDEVASRSDAGLLEVAAQRLRNLAGIDLAEGELDSAVAIGIRGAYLSDNAGAGLDDGHRNDPVVAVEDLGHPQLGAEDAADDAVSHLVTPP